jgi:hypothetical protein
MSNTAYRYAWIAVTDRGAIPKLNKELLQQGRPPLVSDSSVAPFSVYIVHWSDATTRFGIIMGKTVIPGPDPNLDIWIVCPQGGPQQVEDWINGTVGSKLRDVSKIMQFCTFSAEYS